MKIYKYSLEVTDIQELKLPKNSEILSVQTQNNSVCLWAMVDENQTEEEIRTIEIVGTGNPIWFRGMNIRQYLGTVQQSQFVWHIFESRKIDVS